MTVRARQCGFSLLGTLFVLVVVSLLGAYMVQIGSAQHLEAAMATQGLRAQYAAHSGLEWLMQRLRQEGVCPTLSAPLIIEGFEVRIVQCETWAISEGAAQYKVHEVTVTAERGLFGHIDHVSRTVHATLESGS